ncbi:MAG TPA: hypothetical protein VH331_05080 [Allosphingosinicella sp.]|nr:hypothetical protein [Allosphingosinicella sp.]
MRQLIEASTVETHEPLLHPVGASSPWIKPELRRLAAGAAESSGHAGNDATTSLS